MRIPDEKIDEVRRAIDIVELISSAVALKKRGKNYLGLCPFHEEKTPSFSVSPEKQMYHCFGCGVGGNVFTFLMESERVSFVEAVRTLAERAGVTLPSATQEDRERATEQEILYDACRRAGLHFHRNLTSTQEGKAALEYLRGRGFSDETIRKFGLGYSINSWDDLLKYAQQEKLDLSVLEKAGLILKREDGSGLYDRFRGRAMFPIFSVSGRTIAFGARKLHAEDPLGKYINSPETPIYSKSHVLYGLSHAREAIREKGFAILVEGYADLISVYQAGIENIVATSGTALTEEQTRLIGRYAQAITLVYDADSAGSRAALRGVDVIIENGFDVSIATLPEKDDPDSFIRRQGADGFQQLLKDAVSFLDFKAGMFQAEGLLETPEGKARALRSIVGTIAKVGDELKRNFYVQFLSEKYGIYQSVLFRELERMMVQERRHARPTQPEARSAVRTRAGVQGGDSDADRELLPAAERDLLRVTLEQGRAMADYVLSHFDPEELQHPAVRKVFGQLKARSGADWDLHALMDGMEEEGMRRFLADLLFRRHDISKGWAETGSEPAEPDPWEVAERSLVALLQRGLDREIEETMRDLREAESRGESLLRFQQLIMELQQRKRDLARAGLKREE
jgi:DNA primase